MRRGLILSTVSLVVSCILKENPACIKRNDDSDKVVITSNDKIPVAENVFNVSKNHYNQVN